MLGFGINGKDYEVLHDNIAKDKQWKLFITIHGKGTSFNCYHILLNNGSPINNKISHIIIFCIQLVLLL